MLSGVYAYGVGLHLIENHSPQNGATNMPVSIWDQEGAAFTKATASTAMSNKYGKRATMTINKK